MKRPDTAAAVEVLHDRPELAEIFPVGDSIDGWVRWSA